MKRQILTLGAICAAAFTLTNCNKEIAEPKAPVTEGIPFEIVAATADTKTENTGLNTVWTTGDALNVFHAEAGTTAYGTNDQFTYTGADNKFKGKLTTGLEADSYDWYALYPYSSYIKTPTNSDRGGYVYIGERSDQTQIQTGNDSKAHLIYGASNQTGLRNCPLYAVAKGVAASATPTFTMKQLASIVEVNVTNPNDAPLTVSTVSFTAPAGTNIVGTFYVNFTDNGDAVYTDGDYPGNIANLTVKNGTAIAKDGVAKFYLAIKPFTANTGDVLKISVNGYEKTHELTKNVEFKAGKIEAVNFKYDKPAPSGFATTYTSNVTMKDGTNSSAANVVIGGTKYDAIKAGNSKQSGTMTVKVPAGTKKLHIHAAAWKGKNVTISISGATVSPKEISLLGDSGLTGSETTFTLAGDPTNYYYEIGLSGVETETTLTLKPKTNIRFVVFGVNAE